MFPPKQTYLISISDSKDLMVFLNQVLISFNGPLTTWQAEQIACLLFPIVDGFVRNVGIEKVPDQVVPEQKQTEVFEAWKQEVLGCLKNADAQIVSGDGSRKLKWESNSGPITALRKRTFGGYGKVIVKNSCGTLQKLQFRELNKALEWIQNGIIDTGETDIGQ